MGYQHEEKKGLKKEKLLTESQGIKECISKLKNSKVVSQREVAVAQLVILRGTESGGKELEDME